MDFEQVGPQRSQRASDGAFVEIVDRHHAQLHTPSGTWLVELGPKERQDWFSVEVFAPSLLRSGGEPQVEHNLAALDALVDGLRALRIRVTVIGTAPGVPDDVEDAVSSEDRER